MVSVMKMLRLLVTASAYGCIVQVVQDMKNMQVSQISVHELPRVSHTCIIIQVSDERHKAAMVLQTALQNILPVNEQKLRHTASMLARQYWEKVHFLHTHVLVPSFSTVCS